MKVVKPGDNYTWEFHSDLVMSGKILDVQENKAFKFTFGKKESDLEEDVIVIVSFSYENDQTKIELK